uniref:Putative secreted peptide n=1 Tax=Anopheles braziliensis TaxID=58242 RepID=A0A2M3ZUU5_9DIPT
MSRNPLVPLYFLLVVLSIALTVEGENFWYSNCDIIQNQLTNINGQIDQQTSYYHLKRFDRHITTSDRLRDLLYTIQTWRQSFDRSINRMQTLLYSKQQELTIPRGYYEPLTDSFEKVFQKLDDRNALQQNDLSVRLNEIKILQQQKQTAIQELQSVNDNKTSVKKELAAMNKIISDLTTYKQKLEAKINGNPPAVRG